MSAAGRRVAARPPCASLARVHGEAGQLRGEAGQLHGEAGQLHGDMGQLYGDAGRLHGDAGHRHGDAGRLHGDAGRLHADAAQRRPGAVRGRTVAALAALAVLASGCQLDLELGVTVDRDGAGQLTIRLAADEALTAWIDSQDVSPFAFITEARGELESAGWRVTDETTSGGARSVGLSSGFSGPAEFERLTGELARTLAGPELTLLEPMDLTVTDDRIRLEGAASLRPTDAVAEHGLSPEETVALLRGEPPAGGTGGEGPGNPPAGEGLSYRIRTTLPGEVLESTATDRDGRTLQWVVPPGEDVTIRAVANRPGPARWPLGLAALAGAGAAGAALVMWRRRVRLGSSPRQSSTGRARSRR